MSAPPTLSERIVAEREALAQARIRLGPTSRTVLAHETTLRALIEELRGQASATGIDRAAQLADVAPAASSGMVARVLKPFHVETLRPQSEFNRALIEVLRTSLTAAPGSRGWIGQRLRPLSDPTAWQVKSHRAELPGQLITAGKRAYLKAAGPLLERVLSRQREWNETAIAVLEGNRALLPSLERLSGLGSKLLLGQVAFNHQVVRLLSEQTSAPAYGEWVAARERSRPTECSLPFAVIVRGTPDESLRGRCELHAIGTGDPLPKVAAAWVTVLGPGDRLAPHAFAEVAAHLARFPELELIFSDEDRLDATGARVDPFFKPDLSIELLSSCDCLSRGVFVRSNLLGEDFVWKAIERGAAIGHLSEVLCTRGPDTGLVSDEGKGALERHFARTGIDASVAIAHGSYRVKYGRAGDPLVSIIVPFKDKPKLLEALVKSLNAATGYQSFELILVSNNSVEPETFALLGSLTDPRIKKLAWDQPFNYPKVNNFAATHARGELLLFLNNDIEAFEPGWLDELVSNALRPGVGAVGPKLLFADRTIQHAGVVVGMGGFAGHVFAGLPDDGRWTPFGTADFARDTLALTSACLMMRRTLFETLGGFDERFILCGSDVDLCLRIGARQQRVIYTPRAALFHHESATRQRDSIPASDFWESFRAYGQFLERDPFYSPHLSLTSTAPTLRRPDERSGLEAALAQLGGSELTASSTTRVLQKQVQTLDFGARELARPAPLAGGKPTRLTWFVPYFDRPFGGVHTILRFADLWRREHGVENLFVVYDNPHVSAREMEAKVAAIFPQLPGSFEILKSIEGVERLPAADVAVATMWSGAYYVLRHRAPRRAYFIQDAEPLFYPAGSQSALATNTYELGFYGIFNTRGLHDHLTAQHPLEGVWFEPSVDHDVFHPRGRSSASSPVKVFFYGRPSVARNGFELGLESLRLLKRRFGDQVQILAAGEAWDPQWFDADDVLENLGVLPYAQTADLYRSTDVGLVFMFTQHPSYLPLEMMASGVTVVTNRNRANDWLFTHAENSLLARPTATCVAEQLIAAVESAPLRERLGANAAQRLHATTWAEQANKAWEGLCQHCATGARVAS